MERLFDQISDRLEFAASTYWAMLAFICWCVAMPLISIDAANYGISVATAFLLFLTIGPQRRSNLAMHVKLDDLETQIECASTDKAGIESLPEQEIEALRENERGRT